MVRFVTMSSVCAALMLSACATAMESPTQEIAIDLRGTGEALCDLNQSGYRYRAYAPGTIRVQKSEDPLFVRCDAPGNRQLSVTLDPKMSDATYYNAANAVIPGVTWDYLSGAINQYPDRIVMDFSNMQPKPYDVPDYQKVFEQNPELYAMEEFRPGVAALQSDIGRPAPTLSRRVELPDEGGAVISAKPVAGPVKSMSADGLTRSANPDIFGGEDK